MPDAARIEMAAFSESSHDLEDEVGAMMEIDVHPSAGRVLTPEEKLEQRTQEAYDLFDKGIYTYVGAYLLPADAQDADKVSSGEGEFLASSDLPKGSVLAGSATWQKTTLSTAPEAEEKAQKAEKEPTFKNRFFAKMWKTREDTMK